MHSKDSDFWKSFSSPHSLLGFYITTSKLVVLKVKCTSESLHPKTLLKQIAGPYPAVSDAVVLRRGPKFAFLTSSPMTPRMVLVQGHTLRTNELGKCQSILKNLVKEKSRVQTSNCGYVSLEDEVPSLRTEKLLIMLICIS